MQSVKGRRPLKVRTSKLSQKVAKWLCKKSITPNQISIYSIFFAIFAGVCLFALPSAGEIGKWLLPILAAFFIQCRLLCNLFDGMVAVEGGKSTASGELFNDIPDRIADPVILIATGYATVVVSWADTLGWCAALLAVMTAYIRTLAISIGSPADFRGPMAKQHRMALLSVACLLTALEPFLWPQGYILFATLLIIIFGSVLTLINRTRAAYTYLERGSSD